MPDITRKKLVYTEQMYSFFYLVLLFRSLIFVRLFSTVTVIILYHMSNGWLSCNYHLNTLIYVIHCWHIVNINPISTEEQTTHWFRFYHPLVSSVFSYLVLGKFYKIRTKKYHPVNNVLLHANSTLDPLIHACSEFRNWKN